jgi:hypothetical protein
LPIDKLPLKEMDQEIKGFSEDQFRLLQRASRYEHCLWPTAISLRKDGFAGLLPALSPFRNAARWVSLKAQYEIAQGQYDQAIETLKVGFAMARHMQSGSSLIESLVGISVASMMTNRVLDLVGQAGAPNLYWALTDLPRPIVTTRSGIRFERDALRFSIPELYEMIEKPLTSTQWKREFAEVRSELAVVIQMIGSDSTPAGLGAAALTIMAYPKARRHLIAKGRSTKEIKELAVSQVVLMYELDRYHYWRDELLKWSSLPYAQAKDGLALVNIKFEKASAKGDSWLASILLPALTSVFRVQVIQHQKTEALRLIEALRAHAAKHGGKLPASLSDLSDMPVPIDPVSGKQFQYKLENGTAFITGTLPLGANPELNGLRYRITIKAPAKTGGKK